VALAKSLQLPVVDLHSAMMAQPGWQALLSDGLHFNDKGQQFVYGAVSQAIDLAAPHLKPGPSVRRRCTPLDASTLRLLVAGGVVQMNRISSERASKPSNLLRERLDGFDALSDDVRFILKGILSGNRR